MNPQVVQQEQEKDLTKYPRIIPKPIPIVNMSKGYLKTQIERIKHVGVNQEYLENLEQEYEKKNRIIFKKLN